MSVKCGVHIFSGSFGLSGSAVDQRVKCGVHIFTGSSGSPVHLRTRKNLYCIKCGVHVFSGSSGSALDQRTKYKLFCEMWDSYIYQLVWLVWLASQWTKERSISCFG